METATTSQPATTIKPATATIVTFPIQPQVVAVSRESLTIQDLPVVDHRRLCESALLDICLGVKKLFKDGDHAGKKAYRRKKRNREPLENEQVRLCIVYTTQLGKVMDGRQSVKINFWISNTENCSYWLGKNGAHRAMTPSEINHFAEIFAQTCAEELTKHFDEVYYTALHERTEADYCVRRP